MKTYQNILSYNDDPRVVFRWGVGGVGKRQSSSWLLKEWDDRKKNGYKPSYYQWEIQFYFGDCKETLCAFLPESARTCVTSPPYYGLRNYGDEDNQIGQEESPEEYVQNLVEVFREVRKILTDDGTLWLNMGDSYYNYRPGKGQGLVKQTVSNTKQDLPDKCARRGNKLDGLKKRILLVFLGWLLLLLEQVDGIWDRI